jgi:hypothetical protein
MQVKFLLLLQGHRFCRTIQLPSNLFFELIVLGIIPGTSFELGYMTSTTIAVLFVGYLLLRRASKHYYHHKNEFDDIFLTAL